MASVYLVTNRVNGKQYVGYTHRKPSVRWAQHLETGGQVFALQAAFRKYGPEAFDFRVLYTGLTPEFALALEAAAIRSLGTVAPGGYNLTTGGDCPTFSETTRARMSASQRIAQARPGVQEAKAAAIKACHAAGVYEGTFTPARLDAMSRRMGGKPHLRPEAVARVVAGETQTAVAKDLGVSVCTVSQWVRAAGVPHRGRGRPRRAV